MIPENPGLDNYPQEKSVSLGDGNHMQAISISKYEHGQHWTDPQTSQAYIS